MKKLYYECPIIAAYMNQYFGVKIQTMENEKIRTCHGINDIMNAYCKDGSESILGNLYYIHPDSLPIFEPKGGDLVRLNNEYEGCHVIFRYYYTRKNGKILFSDHEEMDESCLEGIVQRNDKQFFMPLEE